MHSSIFFALFTLIARVTSTNLTTTEFNILISSLPSLVLFVAGGCKECDRVQAVLDDARPYLVGTAVASVNCDTEFIACDDAGVHRVPTLKFTTGNSDLTTYNGDLNAASYALSTLPMSCC
jgi:protein disulfide-isomerase A1